MRAVVTPQEMGAIDAAAPEPVDVLIDRAGAAVASAALDLLGGAYGRRVVVLAGKGNNGADGRAAAERLRRRGVRVRVVDAADAPSTLPPGDLVIDAAYGTGFRGAFTPPSVAAGTPVLAVDIPSGVHGLTGVAAGRPLRAVRTITFAALKPGLLLADGPELAGEVEVVDIGLDVSSARTRLVDDADVWAWLPSPRRDTHKWKAAVWLVAGSPGMTGAAHLAARAAQRAGAGYVRLSSPGIDDDPQRPTEVVGHPLPATGWDHDVLDGLGRFAALAIGPGLGLSDGSVRAVHTLAARADIPLVVDGDGLTALGKDVQGVLAGRRAPVVLTPHDGELARLEGDVDDPDRIEATRAIAATSGAAILRKGSTTIVADPDGRVLLAAAGDARLASAGTGDVLTGIVAALLAQGLEPIRAAAAAAHLHGRAGRLGPARGLVASDLVHHLPEVFDQLLTEPPAPR